MDFWLISFMGRIHLLFPFEPVLIVQRKAAYSMTSNQFLENAPVYEHQHLDNLQLFTHQYRMQKETDLSLLQISLAHK
jgi:hypothetical protein